MPVQKRLHKHNINTSIIAKPASLLVILKVYRRTGNFRVQKFSRLPAYDVLAILFAVLIFAEAGDREFFCSIWCVRELWRAARQSAVFGDTTCIKESGTLLLGKF